MKIQYDELFRTLHLLRQRSPRTFEPAIKTFHERNTETRVVKFLHFMFAELFRQHAKHEKIMETFQDFWNERKKTKSLDEPDFLSKSEVIRWSRDLESAKAAYQIAVTANAAIEAFSRLQMKEPLEPELQALLEAGREEVAAEMEKLEALLAQMKLMI